MTTAVKLESFGIEIDHPRNCDVMLQSIPGCRLRGAFDASKPSYPNRFNPNPMVPVDQARCFGTLPKIPGMQLHVNPEKCVYTVTDPLYDDEDMCLRIKQGFDAMEVGPRVRGIRGKPPQKGQLDQHRMKTLCREILDLVDAGHAKVVKGTLPTREQVEGMPGRFLLNPGSRVRNSQPMFEDDFEAWVENLGRIGG